jgi:hypothetical protein
MKADELRKENNKRVLELMRQGHGLSKIPIHMTHFPPRPIIKKDPEAIKRLFTPKEK